MDAMETVLNNDDLFCKDFQAEVKEREPISISCISVTADYKKKKATSKSKSRRTSHETSEK